MYLFPLARMRLAILLLALVAAASSQDVCLTQDLEPYLLFGTETAYNFANIQKPNPQEIVGCEPLAIWLLNRHGAHNPDPSEVPALEKLNELKNTVLENYRRGAQEPRICPSDISVLQIWGWFPSRLPAYQSTSGYMQTYHLGKNWRERYPRLFTNNLYDYHFNFGNDSQSTESFHAFTGGLFGSQAENMGLPQSRDEKLAAPFKNCLRWAKEVENNNDTLNDVRIFESQQEFREMIANVSRRLGFSHDLDRSVIRRVYQMCRYNKAWSISHHSIWCAMFSREDLRRLEYAEDLETWNKYGYGDHADLSAAMACPQVKHMLDFLRKHVDQDQPQQPRVSVQFAEAAVMMSLMTALGERRDTTPLRGSNYHLSSTQSRQWSTSSMVPLNANFAAVLYKCDLSRSSFGKDRYQVLFLQNEQPMNMQGCYFGLCPWSNVKTRYSPTAESCKDVCDGATSLNNVMALSIGLIVFLFGFL